MYILASKCSGQKCHVSRTSKTIAAPKRLSLFLFLRRKMGASSATVPILACVFHLLLAFHNSDELLGVVIDFHLAKLELVVHSGCACGSSVLQQKKAVRINLSAKEKNPALYSSLMETYQSQTSQRVLLRPGVLRTCQ